MSKLISLANVSLDGDVEDSQGKCHRVDTSMLVETLHRGHSVRMRDLTSCA